ncbi:MAG: acetyltransferase [Firmicutes bacterium]|nr:acetyltransferase [Bacillota bacterium]
MITLSILGSDNLNDLQLLLEKGQDYFAFQEGKPVDATAGKKLFSFCPADCPLENKLVMGLYQKNLLIGVFELFQHFPTDNVLNLGLLLIDPAFRSQGLGSQAYRKLERWTLAHNMSLIKLGVLLPNTSAQRFWESLGFRKTGEIKPYLHHQFYVLEKIIS